MLALCLMLSVTYYANYAGIISWSLISMLAAYNRLVPNTATYITCHTAGYWQLIIHFTRL